MVTGRSAHEEIDVLPDFPLHNNLSGNVVDLCPVGALGDKDFLYQQRVWFMRRHRGVCTGCATGCSIWVEENQDRIYRIKPRENPHLNQWWICNEGRYGYAHVHSSRRLTRPQRREEEKGASPHLRQMGTGPFSQMGTVPFSPGELEERLRASKPLAAVLSPFVSVEEAYLLCKFMRRIDSSAVLALGPIPIVGEDERFPKGFTILAEKCPNRRGVEAVIAHFSGRVATFDDFLTAMDRGRVRGAWVAGGYKSDWIDEPCARRFERLTLLVVQDLFPSPLADRATYTLPSAAFAEREGSYVNRADRLQTSLRAIRPPSGVRTETSLYWELLGLDGLYSARAVLDELAREVLYFSAAAGPLPEVGIDLKVNLLARDSG
jgi:NADH-quinone oxidoreductase subunit G